METQTAMQQDEILSQRKLQKSKTRDMTQGPILKQMILLALPLFFGNLSGGVAGLLHHHGSVFSKERLGKENLVKKETLNEQVSVLAADGRRSS